MPKLKFDYKIAFFGLLVVLVIGGWGGYVEYRVRNIPTTPAVEWLFTETNITNPEGQALTRAQMVDQMLQSALENTAAAAQQLPPSEE